MADGSLIFDTEVNNDGIDEGLRRSREQVSEHTDQLSGLAQTALGNLAASAARDIANAVKNAFKEAAEFVISTGSNFEASMSQVGATMGITSLSADYEKLTAAAKEMGATTKFSATEAGDALNYLALAGYTADEAVAALPTVLNVAAAGGIDLADASDMVTDSMSALGLSMDELESFSDKLAKTSQKSNTSVAQLGQGILTVGGTAKMLSGGVDEMNMALGILADNGIKASEGGTALRNIITDIGGKTKPAREALEYLGVSAYDAEGKMRPLKDSFLDLNEALSKVTDQERTKLLTDIFGAMDLKAVNALLGTSAERFDELRGYIEDCDGAAAQMAETMSDNLQGDLTIMQSALEAVGVSAYEKFSGPMRTAVQQITNVLGNLNTALEGKLGDKLENLGDKVGDLVVKFAEFAVDEGLPKLIDGLEWLCDHSTEIVTAAELIAAVWVADKVIAFAGGLSQIPAAAGNAMTSLTKMAGVMNTSVSTAFTNLGTSATTAMTSLKNAVTGAEAASVASFAAIAAAAAVAVGAMIAISNELNTIRAGMASITAENQKSHDNIVSLGEQWSTISDLTGLDKFEQASAFYDDILSKEEEWNGRYKKTIDELNALNEKKFKTADEVARQKELQSQKDSLDAEYAQLEAYRVNVGNMLDKYDEDTLRRLRDSKQISEQYRQNAKDNAGKTTADVIAEIGRQRTVSEQTAAEELSAALADGWKKLDHEYAMGIISDDKELYNKRLELLREYGDESNAEHWSYYEKIADYEKKQREKEDKLSAAPNTDFLEKWELLEHNYAMGVISSDKELYEKQLALLEEYGDESNKAYRKYYEKNADTKKKIDDKLSDEEEKRRTENKKALENNLDDINKQYQKKYDELLKRQEDYHSRLMEIGGRVFTVETEKDADGNETKTFKINDIDKQIKDMKAYHEDIKKLKADGASNTLLSEINSMSAEDAKKMADYVANLSDSERAKVIELYKQKETVADELSADLYAKEAETMQNAFAAAITDLGVTAYDSGTAAAEQFASGFNGKLSELIEVSKYIQTDSANSAGASSAAAGTTDVNVNVNSNVDVKGGDMYLDGNKVGEYSLTYTQQTDYQKGK